MALDLEMLLTYLEGLQSHIAHVVKRFEKDVYWEDRVHSRKLYRLLQAPISAMRTMKNHEVLREVESAQDLVNIVAEMAYQFEQPFILDTTKFESTFGRSGTTMDVAIKETVSWYRSQGAGS